MRSRDLVGGSWLIADMALNVWALTIVKLVGLGYPAVQIVCLRAFVGLAVTLPFVWAARSQFRALPDLHLHALRITFSTLALTLSFYAVARLQFALFTAVNFTRPLVLMALAAVLLGETIGRRRWVAAGVALVGVLVAMDPGATGLLSPAILALCGSILTGTAAIIVIRRQAGTPVLVMMTLYSGGLAVVSSPFAAAHWVPIAPGDLMPLLAIGVFAQGAQACFLNAHAEGRAGFLAVLGYLSLILTATVGYLVFDEIPTVQFYAGAALVVGAAFWVTLDRRSD